MTQPLTRRWLTRTEAAEYLGCSVYTLDRWAREGKIVKHHIEGSTRAIRYAVDDLDRMVVPVDHTDTNQRPADDAELDRLLLAEITRVPLGSKALYRSRMAMFGVLYDDTDEALRRLYRRGDIADVSTSLGNSYVPAGWSE
jgi:excisionase family DNA binding protein